MQCEEIEELEQHHHSREVHTKVRELWQNIATTMGSFWTELEISYLRRKTSLIDDKSILQGYMMTIEPKCLSLQ